MTCQSRLRARYLPVQSNILVSRPLSEAEIAAQGWHSEQMVVDTRNLLHYLRLLPDRRMLLGVRGVGPCHEVGHGGNTAEGARGLRPHVPGMAACRDALFLVRPHLHDAPPHPVSRGVARDGRSLCSTCLSWQRGLHGPLLRPHSLPTLRWAKRRSPMRSWMKKPMRRFELGPWRRFSLPPAFAWYAFRDNTGL